MRLFLLFFFAFGSLQAMSKLPTPLLKLEENVGVQTLQYEDAVRDRPILVELWYPTQNKGPFDPPADPVWVHPKEIRNSALSDQTEKYPLILMSHGHGGDRRNLSWLADSLVHHGFIVASVEHFGNTWSNYNPLISLRFWERARDITFIVNQLLQDPILKERIDPKRIGFVGYSLGGMTGLSLGGARAQNVKEVVKQQQKHHKEIDIELVEQIDFSEALGNFCDPRIKAMVLLSPAIFIFPPQSLKEVKVPIALVASEGDEVLPFYEHAYQVIKHLIPAKLKLFRSRVSHYAFLNRVSETGKKNAQGMGAESIQSDRAVVHKEVAPFTVKFFKEQLFSLNH